MNTRAEIHWLVSCCRVLACCCVLLASQASASAEGESGIPSFEVLYAKTKVVNQVLRLDAGFNLRLSGKLKEALHKGVPLIFEIEVEAFQKRSYIWDEDVAHVSQLYRLEYNELTQRYVVRNLNAGTEYSLPNLNSALAVISTLDDFPFLSNERLAEESAYSGRIRVKINIDEFPVPLRLWAYVSGDLSLSSEWFEWPLP
ncbi:MAG: DUF4390 domain-containing protein [Gammaproteobacteria bacterium]|nr:DUF4390 domain-containing protein [Gammaproteobacteria bacterium]